MNPLQTYYSLKAYKAIQAMKKRGIEGFYFETKQEALEKVLRIIPENSSVSWGGSKTLNEVGIIEEILSGNYKVLNRDTARNVEEKKEIEYKALSCDYYLMSTNAMTIDGKLVNIDGFGNRVAALMYGPKNVIIIAGMNKVEYDEETALNRARYVAAPINAIRLNKNVPCKSSGVCANCVEDECICNNIVITRRSPIQNRIKVILVGERLGF